MDLSLDDIIKRKKIGGAGAASKKFALRKPPSLRKTLNRSIFKEMPQRVTDARNKIIQNNRAKIRDARDKLAEITRASGDARQKLIQKKKNSAGGREASANKHDARHHSYRTGRTSLAPTGTRKIVSGLKTKVLREQYRLPISTSVSSRLPDVIDVPRGYVDYDNMERMEEAEYAAASQLSRTVRNDIAHYDSYGSRSDAPPAPRRLNSWGSSAEPFDPFDVYEVPRERRQLSPDLPPPAPKGILRPSVRQHNPSDLYQRRYIPETSSHLSYEMRSRLEHAPDPHVSMGIFSNSSLKTSSTSLAASAQISSSGYRIVVSNLHTSVTQSDIKELFEDIGDLYVSRIVRPGVAEVIYKTLADAEKAVDTYHNRQLDGQPMKCLLVNPRASNKPTAPAIKTIGSGSRYQSGKTPLEIDIDALHKVLFRRH